MLHRPPIIFVLMLAAVFVFGPSTRAEDPPAPARTVKERVAPVFPELARRAHVRGSVKIRAVVTPTGSVKETHVIGGNPVLVNAAEDAVRRWKFEPNPRETSEIIEVRFNSN